MNWRTMENIPPRCTHYLITDGKGEYHVAYWCMPEYRRMHWTGFVPNKNGFTVTHWCELPAPPNARCVECGEHTSTPNLHGVHCSHWRAV